MEVEEMPLEVLEMGETPTGGGGGLGLGTLINAARFAMDPKNPSTGLSLGLGALGGAVAGPIGAFVGSTLGSVGGSLMGPGEHHPAQQHATFLPGPSDILERLEITYGSRIIGRQRYYGAALGEMMGPVEQAWYEVILPRLNALDKLPWLSTEKLIAQGNAAANHMRRPVSSMDAAQSGIQAFINTLYDIDTTVSGFLNDPGVQANISSSTGMPFKDWKDALDYGTEVNIKKVQIPKIEKQLGDAWKKATRGSQTRQGKGAGIHGKYYGTTPLEKETQKYMSRYEPITRSWGGKTGKKFTETTGYREVIKEAVRGGGKTGNKITQPAIHGQTISVDKYNDIVRGATIEAERVLFPQQEQLEGYRDFIDNPPPQFGETSYFDIFGDWPDFTAPISEPTTGLIPDAPFVDVPAETPDATFTGEDPRVGEPYTPEMPTVQDPEPGTEPGLVTDPEPTPVETPTEPPIETPSDQGLFSDKAIAQFFSDEEQEAIVSNLEKAKAADADADATPSDRNDAWGKVALGLAAGAGLYGLSRLFRSDNGETTDGDINNLPRLNLNLPSNRLGLDFPSYTGGLTPVEPTRLATLPTGVQSVRGIVPEFKYKDDYDYVGYPLL
jgi:hypothetical protein